MVVESLIFENLKLLARVSERPGDGNITNNFKQWETSFQLRRKIASMVAKRLSWLPLELPERPVAMRDMQSPALKLMKGMFCALWSGRHSCFFLDEMRPLWRFFRAAECITGRVWPLMWNWRMHCPMLLLLLLHPAECSCACYWDCGMA